MLTFIFIPRYPIKVDSLKVITNNKLVYIRLARKAEVERFRIKDETGYENPKSGGYVSKRVWNS